MLNARFIVTILFIMAATQSRVSAQVQESKNYVILTVEHIFGRSFEGVERYYWIVEEDSMTKSVSCFSPLVFEGLSKNSLLNCCKGVDIDPDTFTPADNDFGLDEAYYEQLQDLRNKVRSGRKKFQKIINDRTLRNNREVTTFYVTPITGRFCFSQLANTGQFRTGYRGRIFIPSSSFSIGKGFWRSEYAKILLQVDLTDLPFNLVLRPIYANQRFVIDNGHLIASCKCKMMKVYLRLNSVIPDGVDSRGHNRSTNRYFSAPTGSVLSKISIRK